MKMKMTICKYCQGEGEGTWLQYMEWTLEVNIYKIVSSGERIFVKKYVLWYEGRLLLYSSFISLYQREKDSTINMF